MITEQAQAEYETLLGEVFQKLDKLSFSDKMGVTQRLFVAIEDYERQQMQIQVYYQHDIYIICIIIYILSLNKKRY